MATFLSGLLAIILWIPFGIAGWVGYGIDALLDSDRAIAEPGIVYSSKQAESFGMRPTSTFEAIMGELSPPAVRIIAYWDRIETAPGVYDFTELDYYMDRASVHGSRATLVIGGKVPRWPECHTPSWLIQVGAQDRFRALESYLEALVRRYAGAPALEYWQVENELFFKFGDCPDPSMEEFKKELSLVRSLDPNHPVIMTGSGEMSSWLRPLRYGDVVGVSLYREAVFKTAWFSLRLTYPLPPLFYGYKAKVMGWIFGKQVMITELQLEPWFTVDLDTVPIDEQINTLPFEKFTRIMEYAAQTRVPRVYLWGVEWWYWLNLQGKTLYWDYVKQFVFMV